MSRWPAFQAKDSEGKDLARADVLQEITQAATVLSDGLKVRVPDLNIAVLDQKKNALRLKLIEQSSDVSDMLHNIVKAPADQAYNAERIAAGKTILQYGLGEKVDYVLEQPAMVFLFTEIMTSEFSDIVPAERMQQCIGKIAEAFQNAGALITGRS